MKKSFRGGIHPLREIHEGKRLSSASPVEIFTAKTVVIPMGMHLGAPSTPVVQKGDRVLLGQVIGEPVGGLGLPVHASVSGTVTAVEKRQLLRAAPEMCVEIENDLQDEWAELTPAGTLESVTPQAIIAAVRSAGVCGMGGATFPTHIKLSIPAGKSADTVILNGAECEPYLTADHRLMLEQPEKIIEGVRLIQKATGVARAVIAIENNKPDAIASMQKAAEGIAGVEVLSLPTKYPQGSEKQLIEVVTGRQVKQKTLPIDAGALVFNVATASAIADAVLRGIPLVQRITTVTGHVNTPKNLLLRIGTRYADAIGACGGLREGAAKVVSGGPMTGFAVPDLSVSMTKGNNGILVLDQKHAAAVEEGPCIRCARCVSACPIGLSPYQLRTDCEKGDLDRAVAHGLMDCVVCGACAFICPAHRYLTSSFKAAKDELAARPRR